MEAGALLLIVGGLVYFLPAIVAANRRHKDRTAIFVLDLLAAWTGIAWLVALVWAFTGKPGPRPAATVPPPSAPRPEEKRAADRRWLREMLTVGLIVAVAGLALWVYAILREASR